MHEQQLAAAEAGSGSRAGRRRCRSTADPQPLGTIDNIDGTNIVIMREDETMVTLPREMFVVDPNGALMARIMMSDLEAALAAQAG